MSKAQIPFDNPSEFTASSGAEVASDVARLKSQALSSEIAYWNFNDNGVTAPERGVLPLNLNGTATVNGGRLDIANNDLSWAQTDNFSDITSDFAFYSKVVVNFATIVTNEDIIELKSDAGSGLSRVRFYFQNQGGGVTRLLCDIRNEAGGNLLSQIVATFSFSQFDQIDIGFSWSQTTGTYHIYVNGVEVKTAAITGSFNFTNSYLLMCNPASGGNLFFDDILLLNDNYDFTYAGVRPPFYTYTTIDEQISLTPTLMMNQLDLFDADEIPNGQSIGYIVSVNGTKKWWNGAAWADSDGTLAQSNSYTDIETNKATFPVSSGANVQLFIILKSSNGWDSPEIDLVCINYVFSLVQTTPVLCNIRGTVKDQSDVAVAGASVTVDTDDHFNNEHIIAKSVKVFVDDDGAFSIPVVETVSSGKTATFTISYRQDGQTVETVYSGVTIPNQPTAELADII